MLWLLYWMLTKHLQLTKKEGKLWTREFSYHENYEHILHLPSPGVSLFCSEVLWNCPPQLHQGDEKSNQTHWRRNRSPPPSQEGMGMESVLCFRRTYGTRSTICWKSKFIFVLFHLSCLGLPCLVLSCFALVWFPLCWEIMVWDEGGVGIWFEETWNMKWNML